MNSEGKCEQKTRQRRLRWLDRERKRDKMVNGFAIGLEESFGSSEIDNAKLFVVDYLTDSGPFAHLEGKIDQEILGKICEYYDFELADGIFILDMMDDIGTAAEGGAIKTND